MESAKREQNSFREVATDRYVALVDPLEDPRWDDFVERHPFGWLTHLSAWEKVLHKSFKQMRGHYLALVDGGSGAITAGFPIFEVRSWLTGNRLVSIPFATLCDPLVSSAEEFGTLLESLLDLSRKVDIRHIEIRSFRTPELLNNRGLGVRECYKYHYLPLSEDPEQVKKLFHNTSVRQRINRAIKGELSLKWCDGDPDLQRFYMLYGKTRKRLGLPPQPYLFIKSIWDEFSPSGRVSLLLAFHKDEAVAGTMLFKFKERVSAEFTVLDKAYKGLHPVHLLYWEAIKTSCHEGYKVFDFGRTSTSNESLMDFKSRWGTQVVDLPYYFYPDTVCDKKDVSQRKTSTKVIKLICRNSPDYIFSMIGNFCYRHLG